MSKNWMFWILLYGSFQISFASSNSSIDIAMTHCCNIGSHLDDCSDKGIDKSVVNPPNGLCRSTIKFCCELSKIPRNCGQNFHEQFDQRCRGKTNEPKACCEGCKIGKFLSALNHTCDNLPINLSPSISQMITNCCTTATPRIVRKNTNSIACKLGYKWNRNLSKCEDINECMIANNGCYEDQKCENLVGSYRCIPKNICRDGFELDYETMECREWQSMIFDTICSNGFKMNNSSGICEDINECNENGNLCDQMCVNTIGSYKCMCRRGYRIVDDKCVDIDECKVSNVCSHYCMNVKGSFKCKCPNGMRIGKNKRTCEDINECEENKGICGKKPCRNFIGGYSCDNGVDCPENFKHHPTVGGRNTTKCIRKPCETSSCKLLPKYMTFKTLKFPSNMKLPKHGIPVFNIRTKSLKFEVDFKMQIKVLPKSQNVKIASINDFSIKKQPSRALVMLMKSLQGPQTIILKVDMINKNNLKVMEAFEVKIIVENE
ncbi:hypothetical protein PVAND_016804 [Polypedilum vanderplanki]|uniref:EGF-like domain-containing protein n=1 Tax=Polypedilum vanderplanki TaxID=319348 RepID=A0A9J6BG85_POLVA|nr:hypothetical protein PVAND_016804 [Polypedilum vanderplanki]